MSLSQRTLNALIKHPWLRQGNYAYRAKWNAYSTEAQEFRDARNGLADGLKSPEAAIMDWADDITYALHDLEDFVRLGVIRLSDLASDEKELNGFLEYAWKRVKPKAKALDQSQDDVFDDFTAWIREGDLRAYVAGRSLDSVVMLRAAVAVAINNFVSATRLEPLREVPIVIDDQMRLRAEVLKQLVWYYVIDAPGLSSLQEGQKWVVYSLFERLRNWAESADGHRERLPTHLQFCLDVADKEDYGTPESDAAKRRITRAVADFIASLTEDQATHLLARLQGGNGLSAVEPWLDF
jgi:dGTPase